MKRRDFDSGSVEKSKVRLQSGERRKVDTSVEKCIFKRGLQTQLDLHSCGSHVFWNSTTVFGNKLGV